MVCNYRRRVAILTNYPADLKSFTGGVETATAGLLEGLQEYQNDFEFHIVALSKEIKKDSQVEKDGFKFHFLAVLYSSVLKPHLPYNIFKAWRKIKEISPDLIHCQDNMALAVASILSGRRRIFTIHGIKKMEAKLWRGREYWSHQSDRILEWFVHRHFKYFIAISPYVLSNLSDHKKRIFNIPNPISKSFLNSNSEVDLSFEKKYILYIGPLVYLKQAHILIEAFIELKKEFADLQLVICGNREDENYYSFLLRLIEKSDAAGITFIEYLSRNEVKEYLKKTLIFVQPSLQENTPMVLAEAMAMGVPVVASNIGGVSYMVENNNTGLLFKSGSVSELMKCVKTLLEDRNLYNRISHRARTKAQRLFQPDRIAQETVKIYKTLLMKN